MKRILLIALLFAATLPALLAQRTRVEGEGPLVERELQLDAIDGIALVLAADVHLRQGAQQSVRIKAQQNIIDILNKEVDGGTWGIAPENNINLQDYDRIEIWITLSTLEDISLVSSGTIRGETRFTGIDELSLSSAGSGKIELDVEADEISCSNVGSGSTTLKGTARELSISVAGSGGIHAEELQAEECSVSIVGSGDCRVNVKGELSASIVGSGDVLYRGQPRVKANSLGSGKVQSM